MTVRWLLAIGLLVVTGAMPASAWAYWSAAGAGTGMASVATLPPPVVSAASPQYSDRVELEWTAPTVPAGMVVSGYRVVRITEGTPAPACGTSSTDLLPATSLSCQESGLPDGSLDYVVTAVVGTWTTTGSTSVPVVVGADRTAPTIRLSGVAESNALLDRRDGEPFLFFRPSAEGSFRIDAELTDAEVGPASATFPEVSAPGWSHAEETVTSGTGSAPTVTYRSTAFTYAIGADTPAAIDITGTDGRGNARTRALSFVPDDQPPTSGAMVVNDVAADAAGTLSWDTDGAFTVSTITPFVEGESSTAAGFADGALIRESAALEGGACATFGGSATVSMTAPVEQSGLSDGCYRYTLSGADRVGNSATIATIVRVDTTAPTGGALQANSVDAVPAGSTSLTRTGSWSVTRTDFSDTGSGMASASLTWAQAALTAGVCESFGSASELSGSPGEASAATGCYRYVLTGVNAVGLTSELSTTVWVDSVAPAGGALTVNGVGASAGGSSSTSTSSTVTVTVITPFADANAGIATNEVTRTFAPMMAGVCGAFDPAPETPVSGAAPFAVTGLVNGCHRFTLTGTDLAGNVSSIATTVRLDTTVPAGGAVTINGVGGTTGGALAWSTVNNWSVAWSQFADPESVLTASTLVRTQNTLSGGVCTGTWGTAAPITMTGASGTTPQTGLGAGRCYRYVLTGTNALGLSSTLTVIVRYDNSAPGGGRLAVNGSTVTTATATNTTSTTGSFTVAVPILFTDTQSGMASNVLGRAVASVAGNVCGTFGAPVATTLTATYSAAESGLAPGCYRYVLTGTNGAGLSATRTTTVRVDTTPPSGALTVNGVSAASTASTSTGIAAFDIVRTDFTDPETTMTSSTLVRTSASLVGGVCDTTFGGSTTLTGAPTQSGLAPACYRYVLTGTNSLALVASVTTIVALDSTVPTGGAFSANGLAANAAGTSSSIATGGSFSVTGLAPYVDTESGLASSTMTRTTGTSTAGVCGGFDGTTTTTLSADPTIAQPGLADGCYRYALTGVNSFGGSVSISSTVRVGP